MRQIIISLPDRPLRRLWDWAKVWGWPILIFVWFGWALFIEPLIPEKPIETPADYRFKDLTADAKWSVRERHWRESLAQQYKGLDDDYRFEKWKEFFKDELTEIHVKDIDELMDKVIKESDSEKKPIH